MSLTTTHSPSAGNPPPRTVRTVDCCVVGGGPAGMVLALLLARQGVQVVLLEAHDNFDREFRGDGVHPSTLELIDDLGLLERLRRIPHARVADFPIHMPDGQIVATVRQPLPTRFPEMLQVPQAELLDLLADMARAYPTFSLATSARAEELLADASGRVCGVRYRARDGWHEVRAALVVGADGRFSKIRQLAGIELKEFSQAIDVLWLRLPKAESDPPRAAGLYPGPRELLVVTDHSDVWQIGLAFPKGTYQALRNAGIDALRQRIARLAPWLAERTASIADWHDTSLLVVRAGRVRRWYQPGLLLIGDAAHVMSPVFGVGINFAIQDAIATSNIVGPRLLRGTLRTCDLATVQRRRELVTRIMQWFQTLGDRHALAGPTGRRAAWIVRVLEAPLVAPLRARLTAFGGLRPERVTEPPVNRQTSSTASSGRWSEATLDSTSTSHTAQSRTYR